MSLRLKIVSPLKATGDDLARRQRRYQQHAGAGTEVQVENLAGGPTALNSSGDVLVSAAAIYRQAMKTSRERWDAILIDCVFDPAVDELREATGVPTFGPTRTTLPFIPLVADSFSIIARTRRQCELLAKQVAALGYMDYLQSLHALDISYEEAKQAEVFEREMACCLRVAVKEEGAGAILFGSTTMAISDKMRAAAEDVALFMPGMVALRVIEHLWHDGFWPGRLGQGVGR